jgi:UDP-3-O-[3-hydroxymyristoyl] N-acetylglucosamine deacetylase
LSARSGPTSLNGVAVRELRAAKAERATRVEGGGVNALTVEHLFAALAGLGLHEGVACDLDGPEMPITDGCARAFVDALRSLDVEASAPALHVVKEGSVRIGECEYSFARGESVRVDVALEWRDARLATSAAWDGDEDDFVGRVSTARTFAFEDEVAELAARGLASHVSPESVVVIAKHGLLCAGDQAAWDEPARHKLLDLIGDLFLYGGPPIGTVRATRPGHAATHEAIRAAFEKGLVRADSGASSPSR